MNDRARQLVREIDDLIDGLPYCGRIFHDCVRMEEVRQMQIAERATRKSRRRKKKEDRLPDGLSIFTIRGRGDVDQETKNRVDDLVAELIQELKPKPKKISW